MSIFYLGEHKNTMQKQMGLENNSRGLEYPILR